MVLQIAEMVGKENLVVKTHPRDFRTVYEEAGLMVSRESAIPWEIIQLNHDFSKHIFISLSSGSLVTAMAMLDDNIRGYYLYPLLRGKNKGFDMKYERMIGETLQELHDMRKCKTVQIVNSIDNLKKCLFTN